jgi:hypothetical protein
MFIGHYGPALGAKAAFRQMPLWVLFIAVQFLDICCMILILLGIEKARIVPGFTEGSSFDAYYMPYTHGLIGAAALSAIFGGAVALFFRRLRGYAFLIAALAVFSHWILDFVVHVPDLPLWDNTAKVGLGAWRHIWISLPLELLTLFAGAFLYVRFVPARPRGNIVFWIFILLLAALQLYSSLGPSPTDIAAEAKLGLIVYFVIAVAAGFVDLTRVKASNSLAA